MLRSLLDKVGRQKIDGQCKQRCGNPKKDPKRNARDQNTVTEIKNAFNVLNTAEEKKWARENINKIFENQKVKRTKI